MNQKKHSHTVLIIDDAINSIQMLNDVLEEANFKVLVALEGEQAITITQNIRPDIILLDAIMPNMDGFDTCRQLKRNPQLADVPIIFMTGLSDTEHIVMGLEAGGVDYITKPIKNDELIARMQVHLNNSRIIQNARTALDTAGQFLFTTNLNGELLWATPQVHHLLAKAGATQNSVALTVYVTQQLQQWFNHNPAIGHQLILRETLQDLTIEMLNMIDGREYLLRLCNLHKPADDTLALREQFDITNRESDVLLWIAKGKTNREIGQILDMSPRTVNKHLEQIFRKIGVDNRTSAAALAIKHLISKQ